MSDALPGWRWIQASALASEADQDNTVLAAQGTDVVVRLMHAVVSISVAATGGGGLVALEDGVGGTRFAIFNGAVVGTHHIDFGPKGFALTANTILNLAVDSATTNEATATATVVGYVK